MPCLTRALLIAAVALAATTSLAQADPHVRFFLSPSGNISCEMDSGRAGVPDAAFCQSVSPAWSATLQPSGHVKVCKGQGCLGNAPERTPTLAYGHTVRVGAFRCSSRSSGVTCSSSRGRFTISRAGVTTGR